MTITDPNTSTLRTDPAGIIRINLLETNTDQLGPITNTLSKYSIRESTQLPVGSPTPTIIPILLLELQVFENQHRTRPCPSTQGFRCTSSKIQGPSRFSFPKPFEDPDYTMNVPTLCLSGSQLPLQSLLCFPSLFVQDSSSESGLEKDLILGINSHYSISLIKINTNGSNRSRFRYFKGYREISPKLFVGLSHCDAVVGYSTIEDWFEVSGDLIIDFLSFVNGPDREFARSVEASISTTVADQEECRLPFEFECPSRRSFVSFGRSIGSSNQSNCCTGHLSMKISNHLMVGFLMQGQSREWFTKVVTDRRKMLLDMVEGNQGLFEVRVLFNDDRYGSLNLHNHIYTPMANILRN